MDNEIDPELLKIQEAKHQQLQEKLELYEDILRKGATRNQEDPPVILPKAVSRSILERNVESARSSVSVEEDNNRLYYENQLLKNRIQEVMRLSELAWNENATLTSKNLELQNQIQMQSGIGKTIEKLKEDTQKLQKDMDILKRDALLLPPDKRQKVAASIETVIVELEQAQKEHVFVGKVGGTFMLLFLFVCITTIIRSF
jgi:hypothetical protein